MQNALEDLIVDMAECGIVPKEFADLVIGCLDSSDVELICTSLANTLIAYYCPGAELFGASREGSSKIYRRSLK
ncbi:MAG TPA: hypothetical protein VGN15_04765 [Ktedonobacteraceae bacterium]|jgi:hypothetical protein|nr:hypothetical protein [Ktedonobacteraceae bacterium]